jgi:IS66 C-terminal element
VARRNVLIRQPPIATACKQRLRLIVTAKLNNVDPQAWLADVLARIAAHPAHAIDELLPWNWRPNAAPRSQAA